MTEELVINSSISPMKTASLALPFSIHSLMTHGGAGVLVINMWQLARVHFVVS